VITTIVGPPGLVMPHAEGGYGCWLCAASWHPSQGGCWFASRIRRQRTYHCPRHANTNRPPEGGGTWERLLARGEG
jgi:hypothetical protein